MFREESDSMYLENMEIHLETREDEQPWFDVTMTFDIEGNEDDWVALDFAADIKGKHIDFYGAYIRRSESDDEEIKFSDNQIKKFKTAIRKKIKEAI
jgi:hypothetical protein